MIMCFRLRESACIRMSVPQGTFLPIVWHRGFDFSHHKTAFSAIDILRGFAMVLIILQPSYLLVDHSLIPSWLNFFVWNVTGMVAVTFRLIFRTVSMFL